ncbi:hypothetical protein pb186bvf_007876 [Paramecium bursaria]
MIIIQDQVYKSSHGSYIWKQNQKFLHQFHFMIVIQFFTRERRFPSYGIVVLVLQLIACIVGWQTFSNEFILRSSFCTYYMIGRTICPQFSNGYQNIERSYEYCYQLSEDCEGANQIRNIFIAALLLPLIFVFYICVITGCFYWDYYKNHNSLKLSYILWMICFIICIILFFVDASKIDDLIVYSSFEYNSTIRNQSIILGIIHIIQLLFTICLYYDLHSHLQLLLTNQNYQINKVIDNNIVNTNSQQPYIKYSGPANMGPVVSYFEQQQNFQVIQVPDNR